MDQGRKEWYTNKELYEMMVALSKGLEATNAELAKTQVMIRDYNGLRKKIEVCEKALSEGSGKSTGAKDMWGYIVGVVGVMLAIATYISKLGGC